jgi:hypothetical protein
MQKSPNVSFARTRYAAPLAHFPSNDGSLERQLWKLDPVNRVYQPVESVFYSLLGFSGIFAVLYSVSEFLR